MASTEVARRDQDAFELGKVFKESGMFGTVKKEAEAVVKILAGREFGLGPLAAMNGIHMVDGKPTLAANLIAGQIKRHPLYDYRVKRRDADGCELVFFERQDTSKPYEDVGEMSWTKTDAQAAGLLGKQNWKKYPRDMFFARCLTAGARTFCPDVLGGSPIYTAEELGADDAPVTPVEVADVSTPAEATAAVDAIVAEAVETLDAVEVITPDRVAELRQLCADAEYTADKVRWTLLSIEGVDDVNDLAAAMAGLTLAQALAFEAEIDKAEADETEQS